MWRFSNDWMVMILMARFYFIYETRHITCVFGFNAFSLLYVGGEHETEEAKDWFLWRLYLDWLHVLAIYSKCESQMLEWNGMDIYIQYYEINTTTFKFQKQKNEKYTSKPDIFIFL